MQRAREAVEPVPPDPGRFGSGTRIAVAKVACKHWHAGNLEPRLDAQSWHRLPNDHLACERCLAVKPGLIDGTTACLDIVEQAARPAPRDKIAARAAIVADQADDLDTS